MLAGVVPVPTVLLVIASDDGDDDDGGPARPGPGHVAVLDALGVSAGLVVVTRSVLADPRPVLRDLPYLRASAECRRRTTGQAWPASHDQPGTNRPGDVPPSGTVAVSPHA